MKYSSMQVAVFHLIVLSFGFVCSEDTDTILCSDLESFCLEEGLEVVTDLEEYCGEKVPFDNPSTCNCGALCLKYLEEGDECKTTFTVGISSSICGPGLDCLNEHSNDVLSSRICAKDTDKECIQLYEEYEDDEENGVLGPGKMKPNCDEYGRFASKQCTPGQTCYCSNINGKRLFGEKYISDADDMTCGCSLFWNKIEKLGMAKGMRCLPDGSFDPLQCIDDVCYCYDEENHVMTQGPFPLSIIKEIECYNSTIHQVNYTNPCNEELKSHTSVFSEDSNTIVVGDTSVPDCTPDGYYAAVQIKGQELYCVDYLGKQIEDFKSPYYEIEKVNCNCARRRAVMRAAGDLDLMPVCCQNGNFDPVQIRDLYAYCVDENGNQEGNEVLYNQEDQLLCQLEDCVTYY